MTVIKIDHYTAINVLEEYIKKYESQYKEEMEKVKMSLRVLQTLQKTGKTFEITGQYNENNNS